MEQKSRRYIWLRVIAMIVPLGAVGLFTVAIIKYFQPETLLALFAGLVPSVIYLILSIRKEKQERANWILRDKTAYLIELVSMFDSFVHSKEKDETRRDKLLKKLNYFRPALIIWGSPSVIKLWNELTNISKNPMDGIRKAEALFREIRKELNCHDDSQLKPGELMAILVKEKDKMYEAFKD